MSDESGTRRAASRTRRRRCPSADDDCNSSRAGSRCCRCSAMSMRSITSAAALRDAEDAAAAAAGDDLADVDVGRVGVVDAPVAVGHAERRVAGAGAGVVGVDQRRPRRWSVSLSSRPRVADVARDDGADGDAVDAVGLDALSAGALRRRRSRCWMLRTLLRAVAAAVVVDADAEAARDAQVDLAEAQVVDVAEEHRRKAACR